MMGPGSFHGTLTTGTVSVVEIAWSIGTRLPYVTGPCCISMVRLSHPACAITSAEKELGTCNHPFTAVSPSRQIFFRRFSLTFDPLLQRHTDASRNPVDVVASPSTSQVAPVPCPTPPSSLRGYQRIGDVFIGYRRFSRPSL